MTVHYLIICNGEQVSDAKASYETPVEAEDVAHSMKCGVFDTAEMIFEFVSLEED